VAAQAHLVQSSSESPRAVVALRVGRQKSIEFTSEQLILTQLSSWSRCGWVRLALNTSSEGAAGFNLSYMELLAILELEALLLKLVGGWHQ
jgi:hypothetical protein